MANKKPVVSYFNGNDPTHYLDKIHKQMTDINIIRTKRLNERFIKFCIHHKDRLFLHVIINGMGGSELEPNIPTVKEMFTNLKLLVDNGFPLQRILLLVDPVVQNQNGLFAMELLLKVLIKFKGLRIRQVKFNLLPYYKDDPSKLNKSKMSTALYVKKQQQQQYDNQTYDGIHTKKPLMFIANRNITKRPIYKKFREMLAHMDNQTSSGSFNMIYRKLIYTFREYINIDTVYNEPIGIRELKTFGLSTTWLDDNNVGHKIIEYDRKTKELKSVNLLYGKNPISCPNKCVLCPFR